jgi:23S rRNA pseudouridine1911/1915/1917 synthase
MEKSSAGTTYIVGPTEAGLRLDEFVHKQEKSMPLAAVRRAIEEGSVLVNRVSRTAGWRLKAGDQISVEMAEHLHRALEAEPIKLNIIYEDDYIIAINKPPFMLSHPSTRERKGTLINALLYYLNENESQKKARLWPALVHRLDRDTSGVILVTKQERALKKLALQFNERRVKKIYQAIVFGSPIPDVGLIDAPIGHHPVLWPRWRVMEKDGKPAQTQYKVKEEAGGFALVELEPQTGRTHQLRIHLAYIGHPIVGDHTYGRSLNKELDQAHPEEKISRQLLHAAALSFRHPATNLMMELRAPLPEDMEQFMALVRIL